MSTALLLWSLSGSKYVVLEDDRASGDRVIAGPLDSGSQLEQNVHIPPNYDPESLHLGIRFATYGRSHLGQVVVRLTQRTKTQSHTIIAGDLKDNEVHYFSFLGFESGQANLAIQTLGGTLEQTPTVWCRFSPGSESMILDGTKSDRRMDIQVAKKQATLVTVNQHLGPLGWIILGILCFALLSPLSYVILGTRRDTRHIETDSHQETPVQVSDPLTHHLIISLLAGFVISLILALFSKPEPSYFSLKDAFPSQREHAPPISKGVVVEQEIDITPAMAGNQFGLGILMGTFQRNNKAKMTLSLEQANRTQTHTFGSEDLFDNQPKVFAFSEFKPGPAKLVLQGLNGKGSNSPTVWLVTGSQPPHATIAGQSTKQRLIVYRYTVIDQTEGLHLRLKHFPASWLFTASIVVFFSLQWIRPK